MPEDKKNTDNNLSETIKKIIEQAIKDGNFPNTRKFSLTITGGKLPVEIMPSNREECNEDSFKIKEHDFTLNNPDTEIHRSEEETLIYANIPGADLSNTAISVHNNFLCITSFTGNIKHTAELKIPPVRKETMKYKCNNGVLEISVKNAKKIL